MSRERDRSETESTGKGNPPGADRARGNPGQQVGDSGTDARGPADVVNHEKKQSDSDEAREPGADGTRLGVRGLDSGARRGLRDGDKLVSEPLESGPEASGADAPENVGKPGATPEVPLKKNGGAAVGKPVGISVGKPVGNLTAQQVTGIRPRTDWFRLEMDFRPLKNGYTVLLRKRLRWSEGRYSHTIFKRNCPQLTRKMVEQIRGGKLADAAIDALVQGGIRHEFVKQLLVRIGKGNGRRRTDLRDDERSVLARIERGLAASRRSRDARASGIDADAAEVRPEHLSDSPDDDVTRVPYVH